MSLNLEDCKRFTTTIQAWKRPLILTHARADGDAIGCIAAMKAICESWHAKPMAITFEPVSSRYRFISEPAGLKRWEDATAIINGGDEMYDGVIVLDTCTYNQLEPAVPWLKSSKLPVAVIDHHLTRDLVTQAALIDVSAAAASQLVWEWAKTANVPVSRAAAEALFVGLATDTGWFHHSNTDARAMSIAVELMNAGVSASVMYNKLYMQEPERRTRLQAAMLATLELHDLPAREQPDAERPAVATMTINQAMMKSCGTVPGDTEDLVNESMRIGRVAVSLLFYEQPDGIVRVGLRSKAVAPESTLPDIDVSRVAARFGGGGHRHASGVRIAGSLDGVKQQVLNAVLDVVGSAAP